MASRTQRDRQRNETRRKNRKALLFGVPPGGYELRGLPQRLSAESLESSMFPPGHYVPTCCGAKMRPELCDVWSCLGCGREMTGIEAANLARFATVDAKPAEPTPFGLEAGRYSDPCLRPGFIDFAEDE